jgi:hypothetical protein
MAFKPTLQMCILMQRAGDGDFQAIVDLWPLLFDGEKADLTRPAEDVANDIAAKYNELNAENEKVKPAAKVTSDLNDFLSLVEFVSSSLAGKQSPKTKR